jgi:hypothetical protein
MELDEHDQGNYDYQTTVASVFSVARRAKEIFESSEPHEKRAFLNYLLQNPVVQETIRSPFNLVLNWAESPNRGAVVEEVRTIFAQRNDAAIYIPILNVPNC